MAQMLAMMVSRRREYLADASGAELTRNPIGLAHALEKIEDAAAPNRGDQARLGASVHRGSARPPDEHQGRLLVGPVRLASADGGANRGAEGDGFRRLRTPWHRPSRYRPDISQNSARRVLPLSRLEQSSVAARSVAACRSSSRPGSTASGPVPSARSICSAWPSRLPACFARLVPRGPDHGRGWR